MTEKTEFCPNCFQAIDIKEGGCSHCHYNRFIRENSLALPINAILNGRYVAGRILGAGGFGITYKAYDLKLNQLCAVKEYVPLGYANRRENEMTLTAASVDKEEIFNYGRKKFLDEANILSRLRDIPSVVEVSDCFLANGTAYFVMEYLDGATVNQLRNTVGGKLPFHFAYDIIKNAGECLHEVHTKANIFHRDISPENIMIKQDGQVKVIDFGTAKYIHSQKSQNLSIILKHGFAPPEQYSSQSKQGEFTDVYALASTFYFILTGRKVPSAPDRIGGGAVVEPVEKYLGKGYEMLSDVLNHALEIRVAKRTPTMKNFLHDLEEYKIYWENYVNKGPVTVIDIEEKKRKQYNKKEEEEKKEKIDRGKENRDRDSDVGATNHTTEQQTIPPEDIPNKLGRQQRNHNSQQYVVRPYLDGLAGPVKGYRYPLPVNTMITLGRSRSNSITIHLNVIGRKHMELFYDTYNQLFFIVDNESVNGTYINEVRCTPSVIIPVKPGSILSLARNSCVFQLGVDVTYNN